MPRAKRSNDDEEEAAPPSEHPLQVAVDSAVRSGDPAKLREAQAGLGPVPQDAERRCVALGWLKLADRARSEFRFADAHALVRTAGTARGRPDATVLVFAGNVSRDEARRISGEHRALLLEQAAKNYEQAHATDPRHAAALVNWAAVLTAMAREAAGAPSGEGVAKRTGAGRAKTAKLLAAASEKYAAAAALDSSSADLHAQWGNVLAERALAAKDDEQGTLLDEACVRYADACRIDPKRGPPMLAWGNALLLRSRTRLGSEAAALLDGAIEKYKAASKILPGRADLLRRWADALAARSALCFGDDAASETDKLRAAAAAKYDDVAALTPDDPAPLLAAGNILLQRAAAKHGSKPAPSARALELADAAKERIQQAVRLLPGDEHALFALARAEARRGDAAKCAAALKRWAVVARRPSGKTLDATPDFEAVRAAPDFDSLRSSMISRHR